MMPEVAQAVGACQGPHARDYGRHAAAPNPAMTTVTAMIANELLYTGVSLTAQTVLANSPNNNNGSLSQPAPGPLARPSEQLSYLAAVQGLQVRPRPPLSFALTRDRYSDVRG